MAQQDTAFLLFEQIACDTTKSPFLKSGLAIGTGHNDAGSLILREDSEAIGYADERLCRN